ncbi:cytochrome c oxidase assembly protein [Pseudarthrobacter chlorophenolicus]|uniref:cytochrome c oxidase assembly protein n=1 Tax=Pseudarthrobacter chlorophenolicus TaxID=85085 RepID=UPI001495AF93|nr:cytochrome c oxidase assembly protein [Pseudarthrobacter chlorophenolicus]
MTAVAGVMYSGAARERVLSDPGIIVRWGLAPVLVLHHLALAAVVGSLIFTAVILPRKPEPDQGPAFGRALTVALWAAAVWVLAALAVLVLTYADVAGIPLSAGADFADQLGLFVTGVGVGRARLTILFIAVLVSMLVVAVRSAAGLLSAAVLALSSIVPATAAIGHASGGVDHIGASNALGLHVGAGTVWVGGILVLACIIPALGTADADGSTAQTVLSRFSALAGLAFALVLITGTISAIYRLGGIGGLLSPYGGLLLLKTAATLLLGAIGLLHRCWIIPRLTTTHRRSRLLWRVLILELVIMGAVMGLAVALSRSPSPVPLEPDPKATPAQILTGYLLPPELTASAWLTQWRPDWLWITAAILAALFYGWAYSRARCSHDPWPRHRLFSWFSALILLTFITSGFPAVYGPVLLSVHATATMALAYAVPWLLVASRPLRLALTVLPAREDGSTGARESVLWLQNTAIASGPLFSGLVLGSVTILFYLTPALRLSLAEHVVHEFGLILFLALGILLANALQEGGEEPEHLRHRLAGLTAGLAGIGAIGVRFLNPDVIEQEWFSGLGRVWGPVPAADQHNAGIILLSSCVLSAVLVIRSRQRRRRPLQNSGRKTRSRGARWKSMSRDHA